MFISKKTLRIVAAQLGVALTLFSYSDALAQGVTISQTKGTNFVAFEAEDAFAFVNADDETGWNIVVDSPYNRRIHHRSPMMLDGPAAGHDLLKTAADPTGTRDP